MSDLTHTIKLPSAILGQFEPLWAIEPTRFRQVLAAHMATLDGRFDADALPAVEGDDDTGFSTTGKIAIIDITGVLTKGEGFFTRFFGGTSMARTQRAVRESAHDSSITGILLRIDSPGGTVAGTADLTDAVAAAAKIKPVFAWAEDLVASAAYSVASQATKLYVNNATALVGSIGVLSAVEDWSALFEQAGIKVHVLATDDVKGAGLLGSKVTEKQVARLQEEIDDLFVPFLEAVARGRGMTVDEVRKQTDGRLFIAAKAQAIGLIDGVRSLEQTISELQSAEPPNGTTSAAKRHTSNHGDQSMNFNKHQTGLLESLGLAPGATDEQALQSYNALEPDKRGLVDALGSESSSNAADPAGSGTGSVTGQTGDGAPPTVDVDQAVQAALDADNDRRNSVGALCDQFEARGYDLAELRRTMLSDRKCSTAKANQLVIKHIAENDPKITSGLAISGGATQRDKFAQIADQALLVNAGVESPYVYERDPNGMGMRMRRDPVAAKKAREAAEMDGVLGMGLQALARECLRMSGHRGADRMNGAELYHAVALSAPMAVSVFSHGSSDFPLILEAAAHKMVVAGYEGQPVSFRAWCQEGPVSDFNTHKKLRLSESPLLKKRLEGAPAQHGDFAEERETHSAEEWALAVGLSRKMMVNDDIGAFNDMNRLMGEGVADTVEVEVWDTMLLNSGAGPTMGDGVVMFHTTHKNLAGAGAAPSQGTVETGIITMAGQTGFGEDGTKRPIGVMPAFFVGSMTDTLAANLVLRAQHAATDDTHPPQHSEIRSIVPVHAAQLTTRSERDWYLMGPKNRAAVMVSYLNNVRAPRLRRVDGTTVSGVQWIVEFDVGVDGVEFRTAYRNPGV